MEPRRPWEMASKFAGGGKMSVTKMWSHSNVCRQWHRRKECVTFCEIMQTMPVCFNKVPWFYVYNIFRIPGLSFQEMSLKVAMVMFYPGDLSCSLPGLPSFYCKNSIGASGTIGMKKQKHGWEEKVGHICATNLQFMLKLFNNSSLVDNKLRGITISLLSALQERCKY